MAKEKSVELVTVVNTGVCLVIVDGKNIMPNEELEIYAGKLSTPAFEYLIARGELEVKDDRQTNAEIKEKVSARTKKDPNAGKTKKQLEDGGEY